MQEKILDDNDVPLSWSASWRESCSYCLHHQYLFPFTFLMVLQFLLGTDQNLIAPNLTAIAQSFNFTDGERDEYVGGDLTSIYYACGGVAVMFWGYMGDRVDRKNLYVVIIIAGELATLLTILVTTYSGLVITRSVAAAALIGVSPLVFSMIADFFPVRERGRMVSVLYIVNVVSIIAGQTLASQIGACDPDTPPPCWKWRIPFVAVSVPVLVLAPIFGYFVKEPKRGQNDVEEGHGEYTEKMSTEKFKLLMRNKTAMLAIVTRLPANMPFSVILIYFQDFLVQDIGPNVGGITTAQASLAVIAYGVGTIIGIIATGVLTDRLFKSNRLELLALLLSLFYFIAPALTFVLINANLSGLTAYCLMAIPCAIFAEMPPASVATILLNVNVPEVRSTAQGLDTLFYVIGSIISPLMVGNISNDTGNRRLAFNIAMIGWFLAGILIFFMQFTIRNDYERTLELMREASSSKKVVPLELVAIEKKEEDEKPPVTDV